MFPSHEQSNKAGVLIMPKNGMPMISHMMSLAKDDRFSRTHNIETLHVDNSRRFTVAHAITM